MCNIITLAFFFLLYKTIMEDGHTELALAIASELSPPYDLVKFI